MNDEIANLRKRFDKLATKGFLSKEQFRSSLGVLGLEPYLSDRIFSNIDVNSDGNISFEEFHQYLNTLVNGTPKDKALFSFKMLANNKPILEFEDMEKMIYEVCYLWNSITGSKTIPKKSLIEQIFRIFDTNKDGLVQFEEFSEIYLSNVDLIGWYEFLNNEDFSLNKIRDEWTMKTSKRIRTTVFSPVKQNKEYLMSQLRNLQTQLQECAEMIRMQKALGKSTMVSFYDLEQRGPKYERGQMQQMLGDEDPEQDIQTIEFRQEVSEAVQNGSFQSLLMERLKKMMQMTQQLKELNSTVALPDTNEELSVIRKVDQSRSYIQTEKSSKQSNNVYFGHEHWNIILSIMFGVRKALKNLHPLTPDIPLTDAHLQIKHQFQIVTKRTDMKQECYFYEYAPLIFERIRIHQKITNDDFLRSIGPEQLLGGLLFCNLQSFQVEYHKEYFFYSTADDNYLIKTLSRDDFLYLKSVTKQYFKYFSRRQNVNIAIILGMYKMKLITSKSKYQRHYFVILKKDNEDIDDVTSKDLKAYLSPLICKILS